MNGAIDVSGKGFRGGDVEIVTTTNNAVGTFYSVDPYDGGLKGESVVGNKAEYVAYGGSYGRGAIGNGGGGGNGHNSAGGGGANAFDMTFTSWTGLGNPDPAYNKYWQVERPFGNATNLGGIANWKSSGGGRGGYSWSNKDLDPIVGTSLVAWGQYRGDSRDNVGGYGGRPLNVAVSKAFLGGGGGAGCHDADHTLPGGNGGGLALILCNGKILGSGSINSNGNHGGNDTLSSVNAVPIANAPSGAGGGGSVILKATFGVVGSIVIHATGGKGGSQLFPYNEAEGAGGGGGGGYIAQFNSSSSNIKLVTTGGATGITTTLQTQIRIKFPPNGATVGGSGSCASFAIQSDVPVCQGQTASIKLQKSVIDLMGSNINWYDAATGGKQLPGTGAVWTSPVINKALADTFYYSSATNGLDTRFAVLVKVNKVNTTTTLAGNTIFSNQRGAAYKWLNCNNVSIENATSQGLIATKNGSYKVVVTTSEGCKDTSACVNVILTSSVEISDNNLLSIFPNPCKDLLTIQSYNEGEFVITNEFGQSVDQFRLNSLNNYTRVIEHLNSGIYFIVGLNNNTMIHQKIAVIQY